MTERTCSIEGCDRKHKGHGLCQTHLQALRRRNGGPQPAQCTVDGCDSPAFCRGWCPKHYQRWKAHGDPTATLVPNRGRGPYGGARCAVDGCDALVKAVKWCGRHYRRYVKYGDPTAIMRAENYDGGDSKWCPRCESMRPVGSFHRRHKDGSGYLASWCSACKVEHYKPEDQRRYSLRRMYGLTQEQYRVMLESQGGGCAICGSTVIAKGKKHMPVDHCHATGKVRGILCSPCNTAVGHMADDPARLRAAADYLDRFK